MKIAVCEDKEKEQDLLCELIKTAMARRDVDAELEVFGTAGELLKAAKKTFFSMLFLDILLPGLSGMDAALKLRREGNYSPVVFTTNTKEYMAQSYSVWAVDYLLKPLEQESVDEAFSRALKVLEGTEKYLEIMVSRHIERIPYSDIYYMKGNNRNCLIYTRTGTYNPYESVQGILKKLTDSRFLNSHRSYIINLDHVIAVQRGKAAMRDDVLLPIRRGETGLVRRAWEDRRFEVVGRSE
ncbi:LytR/AlgR family response regulator transcription factor [[Clostridium] hylemonae]|uniref:LytR/AlgR family response regulator transcription factor n=1 Tax=[Clostridium] hylemonae TaxID=89153 RepID=UPI001FCC912D|nr:LytTR family DNA-binding domain-containing protein [[Clostridium] hylemonae]BDF04053.1 DNA-binding response regulator [[Clostridium] hylemonae]